MKHIKKHWHWLTIVLAIAIVGIYFFVNRHTAIAPTTQEAKPVETHTDDSGYPGSLDLEIKGILKKSDKPEKGNVMIVNDKGTHYLELQNDETYKTFYGQEVIVEGHGSPDNLTVDNIRVPGVNY